MFSLLLPASLLLLPLAMPAQDQGCCSQEPAHATHRQAVVEFTERVNEYVELHRRLAAPLGPEEICGDPEELQRGVDALAAAIRESRAAAGTGDIFTPRVATFLREHIAMVVRQTGTDVMAMLKEMDEEALSEGLFAEVNGAFPWDAGNVMWPSMLWKLPPLPEEVEYRFVGPDLILLDVRANLVVDILENALMPEQEAPAPASPDQSTSPAPARHPCDVHPELAACWM